MKRMLFVAAFTPLLLSACASVTQQPAAPVEPIPSSTASPATQAPAVQAPAAQAPAVSVPASPPVQSNRPDWMRPGTATQQPFVAPPVAAAPARPVTVTPVAPLAQPVAPPTETAMRSLSFEAVAFAAMPDWSTTDPTAARLAFQRSCTSWRNRNQTERLSNLSPYSGRLSDWQAVCVRASDRTVEDRAFWEANFTPWAMTVVDDPGHLTAYYEPIMNASPVRTNVFVEPIQGPPADLVSIDPRLFDPNTNARQWFGRVVNGQLVQYLPRSGITAQSAPVLAWGEMGEVLSLQIQGSGRLVYPDGRQVRAAFAAHNGHTFGSVGRELIRRGELTANGASMDAITDWFRRVDPSLARDVMNANPRTVFFRLEQIEDPGAGPRGAQGLPLQGNGSIAVDPAYHAYGVPFFIEALAPRLGNTLDAQFERLAIAQDTGGAIRGPLRADLFWGTGPEAGLRAGRVNHNLRWWVLLPNGMDPTANLAR
jgi:membrane-bound lytic murein transglycosylase A